MKTNRFKEIDALRGIAAIMVVIYHFTMARKQYGQMFSIGCTGVDLFFIISGFVIFLTLQKTASWKNFVINRLSRLYPTYWFCVTITSAAIILFTHFTGPLWDSDITLKKYIANMSMLQYYFKVHNIDGPYWTLTIELIFYFLMLMLFLARQLKNIEIVGFVTVLLLIPYSLHKTYFDNSFLHVFIVAFPIIDYWPLFFSGIIFYKLKFEKQTLLRFIMITCCFAVQLLLCIKYVNTDYISLTQYITMLVVYYIIFILYVKNLLSFIVNKVSLFLGEISYSMYLIHQFIGATILIPMAIKYLHVNYWCACFGIALPLIILLASAINKLIEKPGINYIRLRYASLKSNVGKGNGV